jgi:hypothetical protein
MHTMTKRTKFAAAYELNSRIAVYAMGSDSDEISEYNEYDGRCHLLLSRGEAKRLLKAVADALPEGVAKHPRLRYEQQPRTWLAAPPNFIHGRRGEDMVVVSLPPTADPDRTASRVGQQLTLRIPLVISAALVASLSKVLSK